MPTTGSTGPSAQAGTRTLKRKVSHGLVVRGLPASAPGGNLKHVCVDFKEDSEGDPFGTVGSNDKFMEATRAARMAAGASWEREGEGDNLTGMLSAEDGTRSWIRYAHLRRKRETSSARYLPSKPTSFIE